MLSTVMRVLNSTKKQQQKKKHYINT